MFDLTNVEDTYDEVPAGEYTVCCVGAEWKTSQKGHEYLNLKFKIVSDEQRGRYIFKGLHLFNPNAENIAKAELCNILVSTGKKKEELGNISKDDIIGFIAEKNFNVTTKIGKDGKAEIKKFGEASVLIDTSTDNVPF